jgi:hypothetical protein
MAQPDRRYVNDKLVPHGFDPRNWQAVRNGAGGAGRGWIRFGVLDCQLGQPVRGKAGCVRSPRENFSLFLVLNSCKAFTSPILGMTE